VTPVEIAGVVTDVECGRVRLTNVVSNPIGCEPPLSDATVPKEIEREDHSCLTVGSRVKVCQPSVYGGSGSD